MSNHNIFIFNFLANGKIIVYLNYPINIIIYLLLSYIPVIFSTIKTPISFASEQLKTSTYGKRTNHF